MRRVKSFKQKAREYAAFAIVATGFLAVIAVCVAIACAPTWVVASAITSGIKAVSDDCGKTYKVEVVLGGDWFCEVE